MVSPISRSRTIGGTCQYGVLPGSPSMGMSWITRWICVCRRMSRASWRYWRPTQARYPRGGVSAPCSDTWPLMYFCQEPSWQHCAPSVPSGTGVCQKMMRTGTRLFSMSPEHVCVQSRGGEKTVGGRASAVPAPPSFLSSLLSSLSCSSSPSSASEPYWNCQGPSPSLYCQYICIVSEFTVHVIGYNMVDRAYVTNHVYICFSPSVWLCTRALGSES